MARKLNNINTDIFCALKVAEMSKVPVLFLSNPGAGKTTSVYLFAKIRGYEVVLLRGNSTTAEEVNGYDVAPKDVSYDHKMSAISLRPSWFEEVMRNHEEGKKTLLFLDEITTANEFVQAALLHLIFERKVHEEELPKDTLIVSAGNYAQNLSNSMILLPPTMNRFLLFNIVPNHKDLDTFLNRFDGCITSEGKRKDYFSELEITMKELDAQEKNFPEETYNMIGEYVEKAIKDVTKLMITSEKTVDLSVTDLQNIYSDTYNDSKLYGFITFRTLNYLRDITIAYYICFGKAGIASDNYRNSIDGLCGLGLTRTGKGGDDVKVNLVGKQYFDIINTTVNDIEKLNSSKLPEYKKFFLDLSINKKDNVYNNTEIQSIYNKLTELRRDKELSDIERPIDVDIIRKISDIIKSTGNSLGIAVKIDTSSSSSSITTSLETEDFIGKVVTWNLISDLSLEMIDFVNSGKSNYDESIKLDIRSLEESLKGNAFKLKSFKKILLQKDPSLGKIIPDIKNIKKS